MTPADEDLVVFIRMLDVSDTAEQPEKALEMIVEALTPSTRSKLMTTEQEARDAVHHAFGDSAHAEVTVFPAGNVSIVLIKGDHSATIDGHPATGWGWTVDPAEDEGFSGHENLAGSLDEALSTVRAALI